MKNVMCGRGELMRYECSRWRESRVVGGFEDSRLKFAVRARVNKG